MRILPLLAASLFLFTPVHNPVFAAEVATATPDVVALKVISALRKNDLAQAMKELPASTRKEIETQWEKRKSDLKSGAFKEETDQTDAFLVRMLSPKAVDDFMKEYLPMIQDQTAALTGMRMVGSMAPQMLEEAAKTEPILKNWGTLLQGITFDAASWMESPDSGTQDKDKLRKALTLITSGFKEMKITKSADLEKMDLAQVMLTVTPMLKTYKAAMKVYGVDADALLDSVKITAKDVGKLRELDIRFSAFGKPRTFGLRLQPTPTGWEIDPALIAPIFSGIGELMGGSGGAGSPDEASGVPAL